MVLGEPSNANWWQYDPAGRADVTGWHHSFTWRPSETNVPEGLFYFCLQATVEDSLALYDWANGGGAIKLRLYDMDALVGSNHEHTEAFVRDDGTKMVSALWIGQVVRNEIATLPQFDLQFDPQNETPSGSETVNMSFSITMVRVGVAPTSN